MQSTITNLNSHLLPTERQHCGKQLPWSIPLNQIHNLNLRCQKERFCAFLSYLFCSVYCYVSFNIFWCCSLFVFVYDLVFFLLFFAGPHTSHTVSLRCLKWALWCVARPSKSPQKSPSWLSFKLQYTLQFLCKKSLYLQDIFFVICFSLFSYSLWFPFILLTVENGFQTKL